MVPHLHQLAKAIRSAHQTAPSKVSLTWLVFWLLITHLDVAVKFLLSLAVIKISNQLFISEADHHMGELYSIS